MRTVTVTWDAEAERFSAVGTQREHVLAINAPHEDEERPSTGFSPSELLLAGAGACAAWDVIGIMRKRRRPLSGLQVRVDGQHEERAPYAYERVRLHFTVSGENVNHAELQRALRLSLDRYCSVLATIRPRAEIEQTVEIVDVPAAGQAGTALTA